MILNLSIMHELGYIKSLHKNFSEKLGRFVATGGNLWSLLADVIIKFAKNWVDL
jgi:hypothetical protein